MSVLLCVTVDELGTLFRETEAIIVLVCAGLETALRATCESIVIAEYQGCG
jgi:hypothetical protein